jgi:tripartite-type tricarboxylate transporter receptor subunit TctC
MPIRKEKTMRIAAHFVTLAAVAALLAGAPGRTAIAQEWPSRPVRIVVPFPPGIMDLTARVLAQPLTAKFSQPFLIENRPGAGGNIGTAAGAKAEADGYTIVLSSSGPLTNNRYLYSSMPYDALVDLAPIVLVGEIPLVIAAHPSVPANNLKELIALARSKPGQITAGSPGAGTNSHLTIELFKKMSGTDLLHVPLKGAVATLTYVMAGNVNTAFALIPDYVKHIQAGKVKALAMTTRKRFPLVPDVPTAIEQGIDIVSGAWFALMGPAGLPRPVIERINQEVNRYLASAEGQARMTSIGIQVEGGPPERVTETMKSDLALWKPVIDSLGLKPQ